MTALGKALHCKAEFDVTSKEARLTVETQADDATHRAYSLLTGSLNSNGLEMNIEGLLNFEDGCGTHKGTLTFGADGLATSCMTTVEGSSLTFENTINAGIDGDGASMSVVSKGSAQDNTIELSAEGIRFHPKKRI
ncbi:apolipoprotein B-like [Sinocyclocheilus grahami]|uniref:apolipoprotein B-like n=1 Tax=Sinocyclocheilus grahami TaxID=75366 RepID=UPI0007AD5677|nr:PREDICTED: apolipoprotein B-like [Sinocyclocheilus grahami]